MMAERGVPLGAHLYASLISACAIGKAGKSGKRLQRARALHTQMQGAQLPLAIYAREWSQPADVCLKPSGFAEFSSPCVIAEAGTLNARVQSGFIPICSSQWRHYCLLPFMACSYKMPVCPRRLHTSKTLWPRFRCWSADQRARGEPAHAGARPRERPRRRSGHLAGAAADSFALVNAVGCLLVGTSSA